MSIPHMVKLGDSLWSIAHRYWGSGTHWPTIRDHHNQQAVLPGQHRRLLVIDDPNLIYIGQTIMVPPRPKQRSEGTGRRQEANKQAEGVQLKVVYQIEGPGNQYRRVTPNYTIEAEIYGTLAFENLMHNCYEHNFELTLGRNDAELKHKLGEFSDRAFRDLTQSVKLDFDSGKVTLQAPLMYQAGMGPYTVEVAAMSPFVMKCTLKPDPFSTIVTVDKRRYKQTTDIQFEVTVTLNPATQRDNPEVAKDESTDKIFIRPDSKTASNNDTNIVTDFVVKVTIIVLSIIAWQARTAGTVSSTTTIGPFMHTIPTNQPSMI